MAGRAKPSGIIRRVSSVQSSWGNATMIRGTSISAWPPLMVIRASSIATLILAVSPSMRAMGFSSMGGPLRDGKAKSSLHTSQLRDMFQTSQRPRTCRRRSRRRRARWHPTQDHERRGDEQAGDHDADGQGVAGAGELADQALEVLEVEPDGQLAALDRLERLAEHVGQERGDPLDVLGGPDRLVEEPPGVEPPEGQLAEERLELRGDVEVGVERAGRPPRSSPASGSGGRGRAGCAGGGSG